MAVFVVKNIRKQRENNIKELEFTACYNSSLCGIELSVITEKECQSVLSYLQLWCLTCSVVVFNLLCSCIKLVQ